MDCPHLNITKEKMHRVIQILIINLDNGRTWMSSTTALGRKIVHFKVLFYTRCKMDLLWSLPFHSVIGQLTTSWHEIEIDRQMCMQTNRRMDMLIVPSRGGIERTLCLPLCCFLSNKRKIYHYIWNKALAQIRVASATLPLDIFLALKEHFW